MAGTDLNVDVILRAKNAAEIANEIGTQLSRAAQDWSKDLQSTMADAVQAATKYAFTSGESGSAIKNFVKANVMEPYLQAQSAIRQGDAIAAQRYNDILEKRSKTFQKELKAQTDAQARVMARQDRTFAQKTDAVKGGMGSLRSPQGILDLIRGKGGGLQDLGKAKQKKAGELGEMASKMTKTNPKKAAAATKQAASMAKAGQAMAKAGAALGAVAAVAGVILLLVKAFMDLDRIIKDMNKGLVETAGISDFAFTEAEGGADRFAKELTKIRKETTGMNENWHRFAAKSAEQQKILATLNQAGYTYKHMRDDIHDVNKQMDDYTEVAAVVLQNARAIGVESGAMAASMADLTMRGTLDLQQVGEQFSVIVREADRAAFQTKRFYSAVIEASTGMGFYGVRIEETAKLLATMGGMIGQVYGEDVFKQIQGKFGGSFQDMLGTVLLTGDDKITKMYQDAYAQRIKVIEKDTGIQGVQKMVEDAGSMAEFQDVIMGINGITPEAITQLQQLYRLQSATESGNLAAQATQMDVAGPAFKTILALTTKMPLAGEGENIGEVFNAAIKKGNPQFIAALEDLEKISGEGRNKLVELATTAQGQAQFLQKIATEGGALPEWAKKMGVTIENQGTEAGQAIKDGVPIVGWEKMFQISVESRESQKAAMMSEVDMIKGLWDTTKSLYDSVDQAMLGILNDIYGGIMEIVSIMNWGKSDQEIAQHRKVALKATADAAAKHQGKKAEEAGEEADAAKKKAEAETDPKLKRQAELVAKIAIETAAKEAEKKERADITAGAISKGVGSEQQKRVGSFLHMQQQLPEERRLDAGMAKTLQQQLGGKNTDKDYEAFEQRYKDATDSWELNVIGTNRAQTAVDNIEEYLKASGEWEVLAKNIGDEAVLVQAMADAVKTTDATKGFSGEKVQRNALQSVQMALGARAMKPKALASELTTSERIEGNLLKGRDDGNILVAPLAERALAAFEASQVILAKIEEETKKTAEGVETGVALDVGKNVEDAMIFPESGPPLIPDAADTIFAAKPGGPIAGAMGGGGGGVTNVNVYGGDQAKVYETVMRVLKALGHA